MAEMNLFINHCCLLCNLDEQLVEDKSVELLACSNATIETIVSSAVHPLVPGMQPLTWTDVLFKAAYLHFQGLGHLPLLHRNYHHPDVISTGKAIFDQGFNGGIQRGGAYLVLESSRRMYQESSSLISGVFSNFRRAFVPGNKFTEIETRDDKGAVLINMHNELTAWPQSKYVDVYQIIPDYFAGHFTERDVDDIIVAHSIIQRPTSLIVVDNVMGFGETDQPFQLHQVIRMWMNKIREHHPLENVAVIFVADNARYNSADNDQVMNVAHEDGFELQVARLNFTD